MKNFVLLAAFSIALLRMEAQTTCDSIVADFSHTNSGVTYYFFDESILNNPDSVYWHWYFDDGPDTSSLRNPVHYFYYEGDHIVSLTIDVFVNGVWCTKTHYDTINTPGMPLGLLETKQASLSIYPNPTTGAFTIENSLPVERYALYEATGRMLLQEKNQNNLVILPATISKGYYILQLTTADGLVVKRLAVER